MALLIRHEWDLLNLLPTTFLGVFLENEQRECPVFRAKRDQGRWNPQRVTLVATPRDKPLTDEQVRKLVYGRV